MSKVIITKPEDKVQAKNLPVQPSFTREEYKRELYLKILKDEFLRELSHSSDVVYGRAQPRDTFVEKIVNQLKNVTAIIPAGVIIDPSQVVDVLGSVAVFAANRQRDQRLNTLTNLKDGLDLNRLSILLDVVAREALRRYESFIVDSLTDNNEKGVILFARVGAQRMLEYLSRQARLVDDSVQVDLNESVLLAGLVEGRSGAWVADFSNNPLELKTISKRLFSEKPKTIDVETVYARPGFRIRELKDGKLIDQIYTRQKSKHSEIKGWEKLTGLIKGQSEAFYHFGHTQFRKKKAFNRDPKASYVLMPLGVIRDRYDYQEHLPSILNPALQESLKNSTHSIMVIDRDTVINYLQRRSFLGGKSLIDYVREDLKHKQVRRVVCREDLTHLLGVNGLPLSLAGTDFSYTDFSGAVLSGDLSNTRFEHCYFEGAEFKDIISLRGASFRFARCQFLQAEGINFKGADLLQANFSYARLSGAHLTGCQNTLGAIWIEADLKGAVCKDADLLNQQRQQLEELTVKIQAQKEEFENFQKMTEARIEGLQKLQSKLETQIKGEIAPVVHQLNQQINDLVIQQQSRVEFERYCRLEVEKITTVLEQKPDKETLIYLEKRLEELYNQLNQKTDTMKESQSLRETLNTHQAELEKEFKGFKNETFTALQQQMDQKNQHFEQLAKRLIDSQLKIQEKAAQIQKKEPGVKTEAEETQPEFKLINQKLLDIWKLYEDQSKQLQQLKQQLSATANSPPEKELISPEQAFKKAELYYLRGCEHKALPLYKQAAEQNYLLAFVRLVSIAQKGWCLPKDEKQEQTWNKKVAEKIQQIQADAKTGQAEWQAILGWCYQNGIGIEKDEKAAITWYRQAATQKNAFAQDKLGWCFQHGIGVAKDLKEAIHCYRSAATQEYADSEKSLGWLLQDQHLKLCSRISILSALPEILEPEVFYLIVDIHQKTLKNYSLNIVSSQNHGELEFKKLDQLLKEAQLSLEKLPVDIDSVEFIKKILDICDCSPERAALRWFQKSAGQENPYAQERIGWCFQKGFGVEKNMTEAAAWYQKAAVQEHPWALDKLGACYQHGTGVEKNLQKAVECFQLAVARGDAYSQNSLGDCLQYGLGIQKNETEAVRLYQMAAKAGIPFAQYRLAWCLSHGIGTEKDEIAAAGWYRKSAEQGNVHAQGELGVCLQFGIGVERNDEEAVSWYRSAIAQDGSWAKMRLGWCLQYGIGVGKNETEAVDWYRKAVSQGNDWARDRLEWCILNKVGITSDFKYETQVAGSLRVVSQGLYAGNNCEIEFFNTEHLRERIAFTPDRHIDLPGIPKVARGIFLVELSQVGPNEFKLVKSLGFDFCEHRENDGKHGNNLLHTFREHLQSVKSGNIVVLSAKDCVMYRSQLKELLGGQKVKQILDDMECYKKGLDALEENRKGYILVYRQEIGKRHIFREEHGLTCDITLTIPYLLPVLRPPSPSAMNPHRLMPAPVPGQDNQSGSQELDNLMEKSTQSSSLT